MTFFDCFPPGFDPRPQQTDILKQIEECVKSGYNKIVLCMPTGSGKGHIAYAIGKYYNNSLILTSRKSLQDQYHDSFPWLPIVKGKNNFRDEYLIESRIESKLTGLDEPFVNPYSNFTIEQLRKANLSADYGPCTEEQGNKDKVCRFRPDDGCSYYKQRDIGMRSQLAILNYSMYFALKMLPVAIPGINRECIIYDEAHVLEDEILKFISTELSNNQMSKIDITMKEEEIKTIDDVLQFVDVLRIRCAKISSEIKGDLKMLPKKLLVEKLQTKYNFIYNEMSDDMENFVYNKKYNEFSKKFTGITIKPVNISKYAKRFLNTPKQFFQSATIDRDNFAKSLDFNPSEIKFLEIKKSPFSIDHRNVEFSNILESTKDDTFEDNMTIIVGIEKIMRNNTGKRGLILSSSSGRCHFIMDNIAPDLRPRLVEGHAVNRDGTTVEDSMRTHKSRKDSVLVSSSMWQGVDLIGEWGEFCIMAKCPFPYLGDARIWKKTHQVSGWYGHKTLIDILQGMGRCIRTKTDIATVYCLDSKIEETLKQNRHIIPESFYDMIFKNDNYNHN